MEQTACLLLLGTQNPRPQLLVALKAVFLENYLAVSTWILNGSFIECLEKKYKVKFVSQLTGKLIEKWISVSGITSLTMEREKKKRKAAAKCLREEKEKKAHRKKYFHSYENQKSLFEDRAGSAHFVISFDPPKDGNCQFAAICKLLKKHRNSLVQPHDAGRYCQIP